MVGDASPFMWSGRSDRFGGSIGVCVGFSLVPRDRDAISFPQPAPQINLPTAAAAKREIGPFGPITIHGLAANRAA